MRHFGTAPLVVMSALAIAACQALPRGAQAPAVPAVGPRAAATHANARPTASPAGGATAGGATAGGATAGGATAGGATAGGASAGGASAAAPGSVAKLASLTSSSVRLAGAVVIDASYLAATNVGTALDLGGRKVVAAGVDLAIAEANGVVSKTRMVGADGASVVSKTRLLNPDGTAVVSKTRVIGADGAAVVSKTRLLDAAGLPIAEAEGNIISDNGGGVISNNGSGVVSNHGASVISDHGGGLISNNGGGLVGKTRYRLTQTAAGAGEEVRVLGGAEGPALGALLPAAGVRVGVVSLRTGKPVPIGTTPDGKPAYTIYTNLAGGYTFYLPPGEAGNVLVTAEIPQVTDPRARYDLLAAAKAEREALLDEDTAYVTRAVREVYAARLAAIFTRPPAEVACMLDASQTMPAAAKALLLGTVEELHQLAVTAGVTAEPGQAAAVAALARRAADAMLASVDLAGIVVPAGAADPPPDTVGRPAIEVLVAAMREAREATTAKLAADARFFEAQPFLQAANACEPGRYVLRKPADFNAFVIDESLATNADPGLFRASEAFVALGLPTYPGGHAIAASRLTRAMDAVLHTLVAGYMGDANGERALVKAVLAGYDPQAAAPAGVAAFRTPCPRPAASGAPAGCQ